MLPDGLETRWPSRIASRRGARDASSASWVATMTVAPRLRREPGEQVDHVGARSSCRGCRSARRRGSRGARRRAPGRSRRAAARRPRAATGGARRGRRARPRRAAPSERRGARRAGHRRARAPTSTFSSAVSVGIRLNCWKTKPNAFSRSSASSRSPSAARSRPSKKTLPALGRSRAPSSCSSVVLPEPLGPSSATNSPCVDPEVDAVDRLDRRRPRWKKRFDALGRRRAALAIIRPCRRASAGRRRAARKAPAAPASRPPTRASTKPSEQHRRPRCGAVSATWSVTVRAVSSPSPKTPSPPPVRRGRGQRRPERADRRRRRRCRATTPSRPPSDALRERLADDLADHEPLRPAERLQRPELAHALADRGQREQRGEQERGERGEDRERDAEPVREVRRVDERAADLSRRPASRSRPRRSGTASGSASARRATELPSSRGRARRSTRPFWLAERLQLGSGM